MMKAGNGQTEPGGNEMNGKGGKFAIGALVGVAALALAAALVGRHKRQVLRSAAIAGAGDPVYTFRRPEISGGRVRWRPSPFPRPAWSWPRR
jgi:hypothetical protein